MYVSHYNCHFPPNDVTRIIKVKRKSIGWGSNGIIVLLVNWRIRNMTVTFQLAVSALIITSSILLISLPIVFVSLGS